MNYNALVEQTKKELESKSDTKAILTKLYNQAMANYNTAHNAAVENIKNQQTTLTNAVSAENKLQEKSNAEVLAARGLSFSGEEKEIKAKQKQKSAEETKEINTETKEMLQKLETEKADFMQDLEKDYASDTAKADRELYDAAVKQVNNMLKYQGSGGSSVSGGSSGSGGSSVSGGSGSVGNNGSNADNIFSPNLTPKQVAREIVNCFGEDEAFRTASQNLEVKKYLEQLYSDFELSDDYKKTLLFTLRSMGYVGDKYDLEGITSVINGGNQEYDVVYTTMKQKAASYFPQYYEYQAEYAEKHAKASRLDYMYTHSTDKDSFEQACRFLDIPKSDLEYFYETVNVRKGTGEEIRLGQYVK